MTVSVILMASLLMKHSIVFQRLKEQVLVYEVNFVKRKRNLSFEVSRYLLASNKDQFAIIVNQYAFKG